MRNICEMKVRIAFVVFVLCVSSLNAYRIKKKKPPKADCILAGHKHGEKWEDSLVPKCKQYRCINGVVHTLYSGCVFKDLSGTETCYAVDQRWNEGCSSRVCSYVETIHNGRKAHMYVLDGQPKCQAQNKECKKSGDVWEWECQKYTCIEKDLLYMKVANVERIGKVDNCFCCNYKGKCYLNGTAWAGENCTVLSCGLHYSAETGKHVAAIAVIPGCDYGGKCYDYGSKIKQGCCVKECKQKPGTMDVFWHTVSSGCSYGGKCLNPTEFVRNASECLQYTCKSDGSITSKVYGCEYKNKCLPFGESGFDDECYFKKCFLKDGIAVLDTLRGACMGINNMCYEYGDTGFSKEIHGKIYHNCKCEQKGKTGSEVTCEAPQSYGEPVVVNYEGVGYDTGNKQIVDTGYIGSQSSSGSYTSASSNAQVSKEKSYVITPYGLTDYSVTENIEIEPNFYDNDQIYDTNINAGQIDSTYGAGQDYVASNVNTGQSYGSVDTGQSYGSVGIGQSYGSVGTGQNQLKENIESYVNSEAVPSAQNYDGTGADIIAAYQEQAKSHEHVYAHHGILNGEYDIPVMPKGDGIKNIKFTPSGVVSTNQETQEYKDIGVLGGKYGPFTPKYK